MEKEVSTEARGSVLRVSGSVLRSGCSDGTAWDAECGGGDSGFLGNLQAPLAAIEEAGHLPSKRNVLFWGQKGKRVSSL